MKQILLALALIVLGAGQARAIDRQTTLLRVTGNLDANSPITGGIPPFGASAADYAAAAQFSAMGEVRDSLLAPHVLSFYFYHTGANSWSVVVVANGTDVGAVTPTSELGRVNLTFGADGNRTVVPVFPASDIAATPAWSNGSSTTSPLNLTFDPFTSLTQTSVVGSISDDSRRECSDLAVCLEQNLPPVLAACSAGTNSCARPLSDSLLIPADISSRAIAAAGCNGRAFASRRRCRDCYHRAWRKIRAAASSNLFGQFLSEALAQVNARRDESCR